MKITSFNPLIATTDAEPLISLFEELGFESRHTKEGISINNAKNIRMKDANGFHKARRAAAHDTIDAKSSKINNMVSPKGLILAISQHMDQTA